MRSFTAASPDRQSAVFAFDDADVHITCANKVVYKVHSALLSAASPVLGDMIRASPRRFGSPVISERRIPSPPAGFDPTRRASPHKHSLSITSARGAISRRMSIDETEDNLNLLFAFLYPQFTSAVHADNVRDALRLAIRYKIHSIRDACIDYLDARAAIFEPLLAVSMCVDFGSYATALKHVLYKACQTLLDDIPRYSKTDDWSILPFALRSWLEIRWLAYRMLIQKTSAPNILHRLKYEHATSCGDLQSFATCEQHAHDVLASRWQTLCSSASARRRGTIELSDACCIAGTIVGLPRPSEVASFYLDTSKRLRSLPQQPPTPNPCFNSVHRAMQAIMERIYGETGDDTEYNWLSRTLSASDKEQLSVCIESEEEWLAAKGNPQSDLHDSDAEMIDQACAGTLQPSDVVERQVLLTSISGHVQRLV